MNAPDPAYAERVMDYASRPVFAELFRFEVDSIEPGRVTLGAPLRRELGHLPGWFQGGVVTALAEFAAGFCATTLTPAGSNTMTIDQSITFVGGARGERLIARGEVLRAGRSITSVKADVFVLRDGTEHLCAVMLQTCHTAEARS